MFLMGSMQLQGLEVNMLGREGWMEEYGSKQANVWMWSTSVVSAWMWWFGKGAGDFDRSPATMSAVDFERGLAGQKRCENEGFYGGS